MSFSEAKEVKKIARDYINQHHKHLANATIFYLFDSETKQHKGKEVLGEMKLISGLNAYLITKDLEEPAEKVFALIISQQAWDLLEGNPRAREAIVDHELCHANVNEDGKLSIVSHDLEEFHDVVRRHGRYRKDVDMFIKAAKEAKNPMLPFDIDQARERSIAEAQGETDGEDQAAAVTTASDVKIRRGRRAREESAAVGE